MGIDVSLGALRKGHRLRFLHPLRGQRGITDLNRVLAVLMKLPCSGSLLAGFRQAHIVQRSESHESLDAIPAVPENPTAPNPASGWVAADLQKQISAVRVPPWSSGLQSKGGKFVQRHWSVQWGPVRGPVLIPNYCTRLRTIVNEVWRN